jgi:predicted ABC-type ATPase
MPSKSTPKRKNVPLQIQLQKPLKQPPNQRLQGNQWIKLSNSGGHSFAFETTLSGLTYLKKIPLWQAQGYQVKLWFLSLPNEDIAVSRVARRVLQGGHNIPEDVIRRRFKAGLANFHERYSKVVDSWAFYDSSGMHPKLIDWSNK